MLTEFGYRGSFSINSVISEVWSPHPVSPSTLPVKGLKVITCAPILMSYENLSIFYNTFLLM